ncbi:MAG: hypothetical protein U0838_17170 [Chloroflexota bacterium]
MNSATLMTMPKAHRHEVDREGQQLHDGLDEPIHHAEQRSDDREVHVVAVVLHLRQQQRQDDERDRGGGDPGDDALHAAPSER